VGDDLQMEGGAAVEEADAEATAITV